MENDLYLHKGRKVAIGDGPRAGVMLRCHVVENRCAPSGLGVQRSFGRQRSCKKPRQKSKIRQLATNRGVQKYPNELSKVVKIRQFKFTNVILKKKEETK
jgi:hypothetical protein